MFCRETPSITFLAIVATVLLVTMTTGADIGRNRAIQREKRTAEAADTCLEFRRVCRSNGTCKGALRRVQRNCQMDGPECLAENVAGTPASRFEVLQKCFDDINLLKASVFNVYDKCNCRGVENTKMIQCKAIYNVVYSNPCYEAAEQANDDDDDEMNVTDAGFEPGSSAPGGDIETIYHEYPLVTDGGDSSRAFDARPEVTSYDGAWFAESTTLADRRADDVMTRMTEQRLTWMTEQTEKEIFASVQLLGAHQPPPPVAAKEESSHLEIYLISAGIFVFGVLAAAIFFVALGKKVTCRRLDQSATEKGTGDASCRYQAPARVVRSSFSQLNCASGVGACAAKRDASSSRVISVDAR